MVMASKMATSTLCPYNPGKRRDKCENSAHPEKKIHLIKAVHKRLAKHAIVWVAVKELKFSYYIGETLFFYIYIYTNYGNLI